MPVSSQSVEKLPYCGVPCAKVEGTDHHLLASDLRTSSVEQQLTVTYKLIRLRHRTHWRAGFVIGIQMNDRQICSCRLHRCAGKAKGFSAQNAMGALLLPFQVQTLRRHRASVRYMGQT
jgi:hypothetical protein